VTVGGKKALTGRGEAGVAVGRRRAVSEPSSVGVSGGSGSSLSIAGILGWIEMKDGGAGEDAW